MVSWIAWNEDYEGPESVLARGSGDWWLLYQRNIASLRAAWPVGFGGWCALRAGTRVSSERWMAASTAPSQGYEGYLYKWLLDADERFVG